MRALICSLLLVSCQSAKPAPATEEGPDLSTLQGYSLLGEELHPVEVGEAQATELQTSLEAAIADYVADPTSEEKAIWVGRRLGYLGRIQEAVDWYTERLLEYPGSYRLRRHRGHRYISLREFELAVTDLTRAWELAELRDNEIEPDGVPNPQGVPRSSDHGNILYHLGLAHYLLGEFDTAAKWFTEAYNRALNDDSRASSSYWLVVCRHRVDRPEVTVRYLDVNFGEMEIVENHEYFRLLRLFAGELTPTDLLGGTASGTPSATVGYGVATYLRSRGNVVAAKARLQSVIDAGPWMAFGVIAAEADLTRFLDQ